MDSRWKGVGGEVWEPPVSPMTPAHFANVYTALIFAPGAHPWWSWHMLAVISLRDIVGVPPAAKEYPEAEYELGVLAIHPDSKPDPEKPPYQIILPHDVRIQFHGVGEDGAKRLGEACAKACADGRLVPDSDHRPAWREAVMATVEHIQTDGRH